MVPAAVTFHGAGTGPAPRLKHLRLIHHEHEIQEARQACRPTGQASHKALKPQRSAGRIPQPVPMPEADVSPAPVIAAAPPPAAAPQPVAVTVTASIDVGFGNTLFIRGQGAGLNWSSGVAMRCEADDRWSVTLPTHGPVVFKLLVNDLSWSLGENYEAAPGEAVLIVPRF